MTTDKFRSELAAYVAGAEGAVSKAETALADANAALSQAKKDRDKAVAEREEAVKRYEEQQGVCVHEWDKGTITKKPTTTAEGEMTYTCEKCKTTRTEPIAKLSKKTNTLTVSGKTLTARYKTLKTRSLTFSRAKAIAVNNARGTVTYTKVSVSTKAANKKYGKKIKINTKTGKVTLVKGLKTGTYKVTVKVRAAGNDTYKAMTKTAKFTVKVK